MALKNCRECKKKVSTEALTCPHCGVPNPTKDFSGVPNPTKDFSKIKESKFILAERELNAYRAKSINDYYKNISSSQKKENSKGINKDDGFIFGFVRGDESLAKAFWLYFWFGNVVINIFGLLIIDPLYSRETSFLIYLYIIIFLIWNCLALIGVFKSADNYKDDKIKSNQGYGWATTAKIITTILVLSGIGNLIKLL